MNENLSYVAILLGRNRVQLKRRFTILSLAIWCYKIPEDTSFKIILEFERQIYKPRNVSNGVILDTNAWLEFVEDADTDVQISANSSVREDVLRILVFLLDSL